MAIFAIILGLIMFLKKSKLHVENRRKQHDEQSSFNGKIKWGKQNWRDAIFLMTVGSYEMLI